MPALACGVGGLDISWKDITTIYWEDGRLTADPGRDDDVACIALSVYSGSPGELHVVRHAGGAPCPHAVWPHMGRDDGAPAPARRSSIFIHQDNAAPDVGFRPWPSGCGGWPTRRGCASRAAATAGEGKRYETQLMHGFRNSSTRSVGGALRGLAGGAHTGRVHDGPQGARFRWTRTTSRRACWRWPPSTSRSCRI